MKYSNKLRELLKEKNAKLATYNSLKKKFLAQSTNMPLFGDMNEYPTVRKAKDEWLAAYNRFFDLLKYVNENSLMDEETSLAN